MRHSLTRALPWALLLGLVGRAAFAAPPSATVASRDGYLVAPFENASPVRALDWMASALASTLADQLEAHPRLRPVYGPLVLDGLPARFDAAKLAERARAAGARWLFAGAFARPNWKAEVRVRLYEVVSDGASARLREVARANSVGERNTLLEQLDAALARVLQAADLTPPPEARLALKRVPTRDLYALTIYGRGLNALYGLGGAASPETAHKQFEKAVRVDPKLADAQRLLGLAYLARGERGRAALHLANALELRPNNYAALIALATIHRSDDRRDAALELAERALEARPGDTAARFLIAQLAWEGGDSERALRELDRVVADDDRHLGARRLLAQLHAARGNIELLAANQARVVELAPDDLEARFDLGSAYARLGRREQAIATYEELLRRQPRNLQALKLSGDLYRRLGQLDRAIAAYERMRRLEPDDPRPYFLLAGCYSEAGNDLRAEQVLQAVLDLHKHVGEAWSNLGALALRRGDMTTANWYLSRAIERAPTRPKAHFNYALYLHTTNQRERALAELKVVAQLDPEDPECHYLAGVIHLRQGHLDDAKAAFAEAVRRRPTHADAAHNLALLRDLDKRYATERTGVGAQ